MLEWSVGNLDLKMVLHIITTSPLLFTWIIMAPIGPAMYSVWEMRLD